MAVRTASLAAAVSVIVTLGLTACGPAAEPRAESLVPPAPSSDDPIDATRCNAVAPQRLPNGMKPGAAYPYDDRKFTWGDGRDQVIQQVGGNPLGVPKDWPQRVEFRDAEALLVPIGDPGQIAFMFTLDGCNYTTWLGPGITIAAAEDYISTY